MNMYEAIEFVNDHDVAFIRLQFCDIFGNLKNTAIMSNELERAFEYGISFDASNLPGLFNETESDLYLVPDASTLAVLPWRAQSGRVIRLLCGIKNSKGENFEGDARNILKRSINKAFNLGYEFMVGLECEFYLFNTDENGVPTLKPHDTAKYFDLAPLDKGENIRRNICLTLKDMDIAVEGSRHEAEYGQHEIDLKYCEGLSAADNFITLKNVISTVASQSGLYASFMPKPLDSAGGNGLHINMSLTKNGENIFSGGDEMSKETKYFIAGILEHIKGISLFLNPIVNSYKRLMTGYSAPKYLSWSHHNRAQLIRVLKAHPKGLRIELRSPDPMLNPYLSLALLLEAGLNGIANKLELKDESYYMQAEQPEILPENIYEAIKYAGEDELIRSVVGSETLDRYINIKLREWNDYQTTVSDWEIKHYF